MSGQGRHRNEHLLQLTVSTAMFEWVKASSLKEGLSMATWLRRLLAEHYISERVEHEKDSSNKTLVRRVLELEKRIENFEDLLRRRGKHP